MVVGVEPVPGDECKAVVEMLETGLVPLGVVSLPREVTIARVVVLTSPPGVVTLSCVLDTSIDFFVVERSWLVGVTVESVDDDPRLSVVVSELDVSSELTWLVLNFVVRSVVEVDRHQSKSVGSHRKRTS